MSMETSTACSTASKAASALILFSIALVGGVLPLRLQSRADSKTISCLNTAAGGVFFATAMGHMLPESSETLYDAWGDLVPWGFYICAVGFLLILCIDQAVSILEANRSKTRRNGHGHTLVPTEPPSSDNISEDFRAGDGPRYTKQDSQDLSELMGAISPQRLLSSPEPSLLAIGGGGNRVAGAAPTNGGCARGIGGGLDNECPGSSRSSSVDGDHDFHHHGDHGGGYRSGVRAGRSGARSGGGQTGHSHSHGLGSEGDGVLVRLALLLALSVHSVMEGLGVGAKSDAAYGLLFAIGVHKGLAAYALGTSLLLTGVQGRQVTFFVMIFSLMTPLGILIGSMIEADGEDDATGAACIALAAGTFLYVSLMEVLPPELGSTKHGWAKMGSLLAGFVVSAVVAWLVG